MAEKRDYYEVLGGGTNGTGVAIGGESNADAEEHYLPQIFHDGAFFRVFIDASNPVNLNDLDSGLYYFNTNAGTPAPVSAAYFLVCFSWNNGANKKQIATRFTATNMWERHYSAGSWTSWATM